MKYALRGRTDSAGKDRHFDTRDNGRGEEGIPDGSADAAQHGDRDVVLGSAGAAVGLDFAGERIRITLLENAHIRVLLGMVRS